MNHSKFCPLMPNGEPKSTMSLDDILKRLNDQASAEYENHGDTAFWWDVQGMIGVVERLRQI